jgi:anti-sigma factor RsiW
MMVESGMHENVASEAAHLGERLHALLDRELSPQDEASARDHLADCESCAAEHRRLSRAVVGASALGRAHAPEGFAARVLKRVRQQRRVNGLRVFTEQKVPYEGAIILILAAAMAAALMLYSVHAGSRVLSHNEPPASAASPR